MQVLPGDDQGPGGGGHNDTALVEALHILHAGNGEMRPVHQLQPMRGDGHIEVIGHKIPPCPQCMRTGREIEELIGSAGTGRRHRSAARSPERTAPPR